MYDFLFLKNRNVDTLLMFPFSIIVLSVSKNSQLSTCQMISKETSRQFESLVLFQELS